MSGNHTPENKVEFDEGIFLDVGILYCAFCLATELEPRKAVTISNGDAVCGQHAYFRSELVSLYSTNYFKELREKNIAADKATERG